jgi:hypothetical protein
MGYADIVAHANASYRDAVMQDTWGHLAPQKNISYKGVLLIARSAFGGGGMILLDQYFEKDLESSPWLYQTIQEFIGRLREDIEEGVVYTIAITLRNYRIYHKKPILIYRLSDFYSKSL